ncbi:MAG: hypothetical protein LBV29_03045 [Azoarcus sp.]|jgi:hypothetical protein|nr:hypothetical protein [Azoarcus sp.]
MTDILAYATHDRYDRYDSLPRPKSLHGVLRDKIAIAALTALITEPVSETFDFVSATIAKDHDYFTDPPEVRLAKTAYIMADAMMKAREA